MARMHVLSLHPSTHEEVAPEEEAEPKGEPVLFDPHDPESVRRARQLVCARLGLDVAPVLCNEPPPTATGWLAARVRGWLGHLAP
jgi:hypothetical protein